MHQADAKGAGMLALTGYVDRLSAPPGGTIAFKISSTLGADYTADLVRIRCGDPNPAGPGLKLLPVHLPFGGHVPTRPQPGHVRSYRPIHSPSALDDDPALTTSTRAYTTLPPLWAGPVDTAQWNGWDTAE